MVTKTDASRIHLGDAGIALPGNVFDQRRTRTAWFEGQHVTADQFNRDQSYHVTRTADLGRAIGQGVVEGLVVTPAADSATVVEISAGLGLAPSGEALMLPLAARIDLADIPTQRGVNAVMQAASGTITAPPETRTGLYVLAASAVEYTSNPIGSYPVSATSARKLEDSVINEAVLFSLSAYPVPTSVVNAGEWRALAAYRIFVQGGEPQLPPSSLPLAMLALEGNRLLWVDGPMVRRRIAGPGGDIFGLGMVDAARAAAHFEQYEALIEAAIAASPLTAFAASDLVRALPPVGRLPVGAVALRSGGTGVPDRLSQNWLPPSMPVELVALPEDEVAAILRENLQLPPIDLTAPDRVLANTPVSVIVPVPRDAWMDTPAEVAETALPLVAPPAVGGAPTSPGDLLDQLLGATTLPTVTDTALTAEWSALLAGRTTLWYARRRQFQRSDELLSVTVLLPPPAGSGEDGVPALPPGLGTAAFDTLALSLAGLHTALGADTEFQNIVALPRETASDLLVQEQQLVAAGAATQAAAMSVEIGRLGTDPAQVMARYPAEPRSRLDVYSAWEPAITGAGGTVRLTVPARVADRAALDTVATAAGIDAAELDAARKRGVPVLFPAPPADQPDVLATILSAAATAGLGLAFEKDADDGPVAAKARAKLAASRALPALTDALAAADPAKIPDMVASVAKIVAATDDPDQLGQDIVATVGGSL